RALPVAGSLRCPDPPRADVCTPPAAHARTSGRRGARDLPDRAVGATGGHAAVHRLQPTVARWTVYRSVGSANYWQRRTRDATGQESRLDENRVLHREPAASGGRCLTYARASLREFGGGGHRLSCLCAVPAAARDPMATSRATRPFLPVSTVSRLSRERSWRSPHCRRDR